MISIRPFRGLRPTPELVDKVAAKPYDVLNSAEAKAEAKGNPYSFLRISKPEINFDEKIDQYADEVYAKGKEIFDDFVSKGIYIRDEKPCLYIYAQEMDGRRQTGLMAGSSIDDYFANNIKKHEFTRPDKENDRIRHMKTKMCQPGAVFLTYRKVDEISTLINEFAKSNAPIYQFIDSQDVTHFLWKIDNEKTIQLLVDLFEKNVPCSYIADGHHRSAASAKVGMQLRSENPNFNGIEPFNYFLSVLFPSEDLAILDYNRLLKDLNGQTKEQIIEKISANFEIIKIGKHLSKPSKMHQFSMYLEGDWYQLNALPNTYNDNDPIESLDVTVLSNHILDPIFGIKDQRTDTRIDFVGGIRGLAELQNRVDSGEMKIAFALFPATLDQLMNIADAGEIMPPKSTWFEPKLKSGLVINLLGT
ncbi:MAG: DUF1015 domain-containing protein [Bacteroidetes bacterium]|nr:DUF1015 domain-containing protein [Bacteroidota bacterium]